MIGEKEARGATNAPGDEGDFMVKSEIKVHCEGAISLRLGELTPLQSGLKELTEKNFGKLKSSILKHGITFPFCVWRDGGKNYVIDGHQRDRVLRVIAKEGYDIPPLPCATVSAKDRREACEKILIINSQFGKMTDESLYEFLSDNDLDFMELEPLLDLPEIDFEKFNETYVTEPNYGPASADEQSRLDQKSPVVCPECGHSFVPR